MKVFVSWATDDGYVSKALAVALHDWMPKVIQALDPWLSVDDLTPGRRWNNEIQEELNETAVGIFCLTKDGQFSQWQSFEAGALAKSVKEDSYVIPILAEMRVSDLEGPLKAFQSLSTDRDDLFKLVETLNGALRDFGGRSLSPDVLRDSFQRSWGDLEKAIAELPKPLGDKPHNQNTLAQNFTDDVAFSKVLDTYDEMIKLARDTNNVVNQLMSSSGGSAIQRSLTVRDTSSALHINDLLQPQTPVQSFVLTQAEESADIETFKNKLVTRTGLKVETIRVMIDSYGGAPHSFAVRIKGQRLPDFEAVRISAAVAGFSISSVKPDL